MPDLKPSEAIAQHRNLIYRQALEKLKNSELLNDQELAEVQRREASELERKEAAERKAKKETRGRKSKLSKEFIKRVAALIEEGHDLKDVCDALGIAVSTLCAWRTKEEEGGLYLELKEAIQEAEGKAAIWHVNQIRKAAANGAWQASMEWLGRRRSEAWARKEYSKSKVEVSGPNGSALPNNNATIIFIPDNGRSLPKEILNADEPKRIELNGNRHVNGNGH